MRRREFIIGMAAAASASGPAVGRLDTTPSIVETADSEIEAIVFESSCSLLDANGDELTDSSTVAVRLEETATNHDEDGNGDATLYGEDTPIPVVAVDGNVVGFGGVLVEDETNWERGNEEFLLNVWDDYLGGSGTVLWDEGHNQYYDLSTVTEFEEYAESNGYTVESTTSLASDLPGADAAVITSPSSSLTSNETDALADFVSNGGAVFLHDQSDYSDFDETTNMNDVASSLGLSFRFNDDEVIDDRTNDGVDYAPVTGEFNTDFDFFADREGLGLDRSGTYTVDVTEVTDGDTVTVEFDDGSTESVRILGNDTPETAQNSEYERLQEWEGIDDETHLQNWADEGTQFGVDELDGETVDLTFDEEEPIRDVYGRVLGYIWYDADGDGSRDTLYNYQCVEQGYARVYGSGFVRHDEFWQAEADARANDRRVWAASDPENSSEIRDRPVDDVFFPQTASVRTDSGAIDDSRVPVYAESTASQDLDGGVSYSEPPLVGVDETAGVAVVGGPMIDESYEDEEGFDVDTADYENFVFLTNLLDYLSSTTGDVLIDGGHGQFAASYALSNEDAAYYQRYLEGQGLGFEQVNDLDAADLSRGRALIVTTPSDAFTQDEIDAVNSFVADGGAVVLMGAGDVTSEPRTNLNDLAAALGTDLRLNEDQVTDDSNNVDGDAAIPETTSFDTSFDLFDAYTSDDGGSDGEIAVAEIHPDAAGNDNDNLNDEYVVFENVGSEVADLTGWTVQDEADKTYGFPDSFTLDAGAQVTLHSGSGSDTDTELYWGASQGVWNNDGDTVFLYDAQGDLVTSESYSDVNPLVSTDGETDVGDTAATLNGTLDQLGGASSVDVAFEYREVGASSWTTTATQTLTSTGSYSEEVTGLSSGVDYEFRAVADASDGDSATGTTATFTTQSGGSNAPAVDSYAVTEAGSPNPHAEITADWTVSDADGDLDEVAVEVFDSAGSLVDSATTSVGGSSASGSDSFQIKSADGQTFDVTLTVTDAAGNAASETQSVTE